MRTYVCLFIGVLLFAPMAVRAQLYYPPVGSATWETVPPATIGWDVSRLDSLQRWLEQTQTKAFIVLYRGRIVVEWYLNGHSQDANFQWASAGKTITALAVGIAQEQGHLSIADKTSDYIGTGWTSATPDQESAITIWHQLTMTNGLEDNQLITDPFCTEPACLLYRAPAGTSWAYHNAPYTLLDTVVEEATGVSYNTFIANTIRNPIGMNGAFLRVGYNNVYFSNARSMARFGILIQAGGSWNGTPLITDTAYFNAMMRPSQTINRSYGYLWWLNGQESYRVPQSQLQFSGSYAPSAPADLVAGIGADGQILAYVPSQELLVIRQGDNPGDGSPAPVSYVDSIWTRINYVQLVTSSDPTSEAIEKPYRLYPNPVADYLTLEAAKPTQKLSGGVYTLAGQLALGLATPGTWPLTELAPGTYLVRISDGSRSWTERIVKR